MLLGPRSVEHLLELRGRDVADLAVQPPVVEPVDVLERGELDLVAGAPRSLPADQLGLVQADRGLGHRVVVAVPDAPNRRCDAVLGETLGVDDRGGLTGFKRSSQHWPVGVTVVARRGLRPESSS